MPNDQTVEDLLARLERERVAADRAYNDALTAVDRALGTAPHLPDPPPPYDGSTLPELNRRWDILPDGAPGVERSLKGRLRAFIWRLVGPSLETQKRFNAALVDHLNRNVAAHEAAAQATGAAVSTLARELRARERFESILVQYLQTITAYVDTKDRSLAGSELRDRVALTEQRLLALKREVERGGSAGAVARQPADALFSGEVDAVTYVGFEDRFRGTDQEIRRRVDDYLPILEGASNVVDIGCGRGELLSRMGERGITAKGLDANPAMAALCRARGLDVEEGDALAFLERQPDASLGGLVSLQVVEHFAPGYLLRFLEAAYHKLRPGAPIVLETINPACWMAFFETYLRDPTHRQALHPDTLRFLVQAAGFSSVDVQFRAPVSDTDRLPTTGRAGPAARAGRPGETPLAEAISELATVVNAHAEQLNSRLFSSMDYVVVGRR